MNARRTLLLFCATFVLTEARWQKKRDATSVCDPAYNSTSKILCYCMKDIRQPELIRSADCYLTTEGVKLNDHSWDAFDALKTVTKITLTNSRSVALQYIPTHALKHVEGLIVLDVKYGNIETIHPYAFANLSSLEEINIRDSQVKVLQPHSFAHLRDLTEIKLDKNNIIEINRDVFIDLPSLERLFLTSNQITTIHDKAFIHLSNLKELEINMNKLFSLNSETFSGLNKLQKLDLSSNNLEVIGDNTFLPLKNLQSLTLEGNKIQMLDEKAFNGLETLLYLSLAHNKLSNIENEKTFTGLVALKTLSLRSNELREFKTQVMAPLLNNFREHDSHLDIEDNSFPCDCRLDWFMTLMNETRSKNLKIAMENLKCVPDAQLRDKWNNLEETEKNSGQVFEADDNQPPAEYEYYDESQLNGKLFFTDVREMINCNHEIPSVNEATTQIAATFKSTKAPSPTIVTAATNPPRVSTPVPVMKSTPKLVAKTNELARDNGMVTNQGVLDLSMYETTPKQVKGDDSDDKNNMIVHRPDSFTTSRLVTVSANPIEKTNVYDNMASDEAQPDKLKAQRSIQDDLNISSSGHKTVGCVSLTALICYRLLN